MQTVRVFGPNLSSEGQRKADLHVHAKDCRDCRDYGPRGRFGGDDGGWTITLGSRDEVVMEIYPPEDFNYNPDSEEMDVYRSDVWFAPCVTL